jgi:hypothetical protein
MERLLSEPSTVSMGGVVMTDYAIVETDDGLTVAEIEPGITPEEAAVKRGGVLIDPGPYPSFGEACDAMLAIPDEDEDEETR